MSKIILLILGLICLAGVSLADDLKYKNGFWCVWENRQFVCTDDERCVPVETMIKILTTYSNLSTYSSPVGNIVCAFIAKKDNMLYYSCKEKLEEDNAFYRRKAEDVLRRAKEYGVCGMGLGNE